MKLSKTQRETLTRLQDGYHLSFPDLSLPKRRDVAKPHVGMPTLCRLLSLGLVKIKKYRIYGPDWRKTGEVYDHKKVVLTAAGRKLVA